MHLHLQVWLDPEAEMIRSGLLLSASPLGYTMLTPFSDTPPYRGTMDAGSPRYVPHLSAPPKEREFISYNYLKKKKVIPWVYGFALDIIESSVFS